MNPRPGCGEDEFFLSLTAVTLTDPFFFFFFWRAHWVVIFGLRRRDYVPFHTLPLYILFANTFFLMSLLSVSWLLYRQCFFDCRKP